MNDTKEITNILNTYAQIADDLGDYKTADECYELMKEAETFENSSIRTAAIREAFFKKLWKGIKNVGKAIDRGVRKIVPGGWGTVLGLVAAPYLAKLPAALKGTGGKVLDFVKSGGDPTTLLNSSDPFVQQAASLFMSSAKGATSGSADGSGGSQSMTSTGPSSPYGIYGAGSLPTTQSNEKQTKLNQAKSLLYNSTNQGSAQQAFDQFVKVEVPNYNKNVPQHLKITRAEIDRLKGELKQQRRYDLKG